METHTSDSSAANSTSDSEKEIPRLDPIPDGGYGWFVLLSTFIINFNTWGANSGFAVYLAHYLSYDTFANATKYDYAFIGGLALGAGLLFAPAINYLQSFIGFRPTMILGMFLQFTGLMLASFASKLWQLYLTQGLLQGLGMAFMALPALSILPQWFQKKRGFASAISVCGSGCGGIVYNLGMQQVMETRSVQWALRSQAIMCFGLSTISCLLIRRRLPIKRVFVEVQILQSAGFYLTAAYFVICMLGFVTVMIEMGSFTVSKGYSGYQGSISSALIQVGFVVGRPIVGRLADAFGHITVTAMAYLISTIFVFAMWIPAKNLATIYAFCIMSGAVMGTQYVTLPALLAKMFGLRNVNVSLCMVCVFCGIGGVFGPVVGLSLTQDPSSGVSNLYLHTAIFVGCSYLCSVLLLLVIRGYLAYRHEKADQHSDEGHMHITVPLWAPFGHAFLTKHKI